MRHALSCVDVSEVSANSYLHDKVPECQNDLGANNSEEQSNPFAFPSESRQRDEQNPVKEIPGGVEGQFPSGSPPACWKPGLPFVLVDCVEGSDESLYSQQIERDLHLGKSF